MKATIKESVNEVYKNMNQNASFNKNIHNFNKNISNINGLRNNSSNNTRKNNTNNNRNTKQPVYQNIENDNRENYNAPNKGNFTMIMIIFCIFLVSILGGFVIYFKDKIFDFLNFDNNDSTKVEDSEVDTLKNVLDEKIKKEEEMQKEIIRLKKTSTNDAPREENTTSVSQTDTSVKTNKDDSNIKQQYSDSMMVKEDGYCYIGTDDNMRHCVDAYTGDICSSGDVYRRMDDCLIPKLSQDHCGP